MPIVNQLVLTLFPGVDVVELSGSETKSKHYDVDLMAVLHAKMSMDSGQYTGSCLQTI